MKTGKEVLEQALRLLGYTNHTGDIDAVRDAELFKSGSAKVRQIYYELQRIEHPDDIDTDFNMTKELKLSPIAIEDVMPYGVAMLIAQSDGNYNSQTLFAQLYNQKRSSVPKPVARVKDVIPRGGY